MPQGPSRHLEVKRALVVDSPSALERLAALANAKESTTSGERLPVASTRLMSVSIGSRHEPLTTVAMVKVKHDKGVAWRGFRKNYGSAEQEHMIRCLEFSIKFVLKSLRIAHFAMHKERVVPGAIGFGERISRTETRISGKWTKETLSATGNGSFVVTHSRIRCCLSETPR